MQNLWYAFVFIAPFIQTDLWNMPVRCSIRVDKTEFHIQNESDYAIGLAHGMILTGFLSDFRTQNNREPNQEEIKAPFF
jgi:hypothetical protein